MEKLAQAHHTSLGQEIQIAMRLYINRHKKPHINDIANGIIYLAEEAERRSNQNIKQDGLTSRGFLGSISDALVNAQLIAKPIEPTDNTRTLSYLTAESVLALLARGMRS
jgi:hypothetical protein